MHAHKILNLITEIFVSAIFDIRSQTFPRIDYCREAIQVTTLVRVKLK